MERVACAREHPGVVDYEHVSRPQVIGKIADHGVEQTLGSSVAASGGVDEEARRVTGLHAPTVAMAFG